ncbi:hypothetical protein Shyhy01_19610 [Streptomyces hygroscopicus subsp. hygroscopicus]|nr:hypothetical protein Shyhy01_19610 [Streptomyces hygroscopicus subsp. hygroscopicus]
MARRKPWDVDDELWAVIEPLLPKVERRVRHPGRKRHPDRLVFQGILFVLHTGIAWEHLPQELGFGSGAWPNGPRRGCGHGYTRSSSPSSAARMPWTSPVRLSTAPTSAR